MGSKERPWRVNTRLHGEAALGNWTLSAGGGGYVRQRPLSLQGHSQGKEKVRAGLRESSFGVQLNEERCQKEGSNHIVVSSFIFSKRYEVQLVLFAEQVQMLSASSKF